MAKHLSKLSICPNCNTGLPHHENYCPNCGQQNHELKLPLGHLVYEVVESITHFDDKLWLTLKAIFTRPGRITADFLVGKRIRYVPPVRFYVFVSVIFFFLVGRFADHQLEKSLEAYNQATSDTTQRGVSLDLNGLIDQDSLLKARQLYLLARKVKVTTPLNAKGMTRTARWLKQTSPIQRDSLLIKNRVEVNAKNQRGLADLIALAPGTFNARPLGDSISLLGVTFKFKDGASLKTLLQKTHRMDDKSLDSLIRAQGGKPGWFKRMQFRQMDKFMSSREDSARALTHVIVKNLSVVMFVLMPFVAVLLLLFYFRRGRYYYEHLIFSVHIHTVIFLVVSLALLGTYYADKKVIDLVVSCTLFVCWIYFLLSLKAVYRQGWLKTTVKFLLLSFSYSVLASLFYAGVVLWGFATF